MSPPVTTLAHAGGWDEALFVLVPMALVVILMRAGAKRTPPEEPGADEPDRSGEPDQDQQVT